MGIAELAASSGVTGSRRPAPAGNSEHLQALISNTPTRLSSPTSLALLQLSHRAADTQPARQESTCLGTTLVADYRMTPRWQPGADQVWCSWTRRIEKISRLGRYRNRLPRAWSPNHRGIQRRSDVTRRVRWPPQPQPPPPVEAGRRCRFQAQWVAGPVPRGGALRSGPAQRSRRHHAAACGDSVRPPGSHELRPIALACQGWATAERPPVRPTRSACRDRPSAARISPVWLISGHLLGRNALCGVLSRRRNLVVSICRVSRPGRDRDRATREPRGVNSAPRKSPSRGESGDDPLPGDSLGEATGTALPTGGWARSEPRRRGWPEPRSGLGLSEGPVLQKAAPGPPPKL